MENASKALIMAAEVLIGVIIISIGVALFTIFSGYTKNAAETMTEAQITEFNNNFLKYDGKKVTAHDIITIANFARQNNMKYDDFVDDNGKPETLNAEDGSYYIQVLIKDGLGNMFNGSDHMETVEEQVKNDFLKNYSIIKSDDPETNGTPYTFGCEVNISPGTFRVNKITFRK